MKITIIGLGLVGGSLGLDLKRNGFASHRIGVDEQGEHGALALKHDLVDEILPIAEACKEAELVMLAVPVKAIVSLLPKVLDLVGAETMVMDMGSTKGEIIASISDHARREQFVAVHPMAGTEFSGPAAAINDLFQNKVAIICDREHSLPQAVNIAERLLKSLFMRIIYMDGQDHDVHAAYVSHVSHITSFVLALTVLDKEESEANIFNLASGGFASTVRLAKSSPRMWREVFEQNSNNVVDVLDIYIDKMQSFRDHIAQGDFEKTQQLMSKANDIGRILQAREVSTSS